MFNGFRVYFDENAKKESEKDVVRRWAIERRYRNDAVHEDDCYLCICITNTEPAAMLIIHAAGT